MQRSHAGLTYDPKAGGLLLYGGVPPLCLPSASQRELNTKNYGATWFYGATRWIPHYAAQTSVSVFGGVAFDGTLGEPVFLAASTAKGADTTLIYGQAGWQRLPVKRNPPGGALPVTVADGASGEVIAWDASPSGGTEIWSFNGRTWNEEAIPAGLARLNYVTMAYDSAHRRIVLIGSQVAGGGLQTWFFAGSTWSKDQAGGGPQQDELAPTGQSAAFDPSLGAVVLLASMTNLSMETWELRGERWTELDPKSEPLFRVGEAIANDPLGKDVVIFGGAGEPTHNHENFYNDFWSFDKGDWVRLNA